MPFTSYKPDKLKQLAEKELKPLLAEKRPDKKKVDEVSARIAAIGVKDMNGVKAEFVKAQQQVQALYGMAMKALDEAKKAMADYKVDPNPVQNKKTYEKIIDTEGFIQGLHDTAKATMKEFGQSWFEYRGFNAEKAIGLSKKHSEGFNKIIGKVMNDQKQVTSLEKKMETLLAAAEKLAGLAKGISQIGGVGSKEQNKKIEAAIDKSIDRAKKLLAEMENGRATGISSLENLPGRMKTSKRPKKDSDLEDLKRTTNGQRENSIAVLKFHKDAATTIQKLVKTTEGMISSDQLKDKGIAGKLKELKEQEEQAKKFFARANAAFKLVIEQVNRINDMK